MLNASASSTINWVPGSISWGISLAEDLSEGTSGQVETLTALIDGQNINTSVSSADFEASTALDTVLHGSDSVEVKGGVWHTAERWVVDISTEVRVVFGADDLSSRETSLDLRGKAEEGEDGNSDLHL